MSDPNILDRIHLSILDYIDVAEAGDAGGIILSEKQWTHARMRALRDASGSTLLFCGDGYPTLFGLRVIVASDSAGPLIVSKGFMAAMSWYPKLRLRLL